MEHLSHAMITIAVIVFLVFGLAQCSSCQCVEGCTRYSRECKETDTGCRELASKCFDACKESGGLIHIGK